VGTVQQSNHHVALGDDRAMGDLIEGITDGDRVGSEVVVPLAQNEALLAFNTTPYTNNVGGSGVGA